MALYVDWSFTAYRVVSRIGFPISFCYTLYSWLPGVGIKSQSDAFSYIDFKPE